MAEIALNGVSKSYGIKEILTDVSFNINKGDRVGVVGINGAGKTTLFNIMTGDESPDSGNIYIKNNIKIAHMEQNINISSEKSIYDFLLAEFDYIFEMKDKLKSLEKELETLTEVREIEAKTVEYNDLMEKYKDLDGLFFKSKVEGMLKGMGFSEERFKDPVNSLSGGEKSRLSLAKMMLSNSDVLLLDEPTNHLDMASVEFLENYLKDLNKVVVIISHDRYFLDKVVNRIFLINNKRLYVYNSSYSRFMEDRKKDLEVEKRAYDNQQKEIERQEEIIFRLSKQGGSLRKRGIAQSRSRQKLLDKMKRIEKPHMYDEKMRLSFKPSRESGEDVLEVKDLTMAFGDRVLYEGIGFNIYKGEKVGLIGGNGTGKTTLFKIILNKLRPTGGAVNLGVGVFPEYFDQQQANLNLDNTAIDEVWDEYPNLTHYDLRSYLAKFMFIGDDIFKMVGDLSGGERARISLLKLMLSSSNFLLLDEPTNHLDIESKEVLEDALNDYEATCFIISHDRYFLNKVCDRIIVIEDGTITQYEGNYDYYMQKLLEKKEAEKSDGQIVAESKTELRKIQRKSKEEEKRLRKLKADIRQLENDIEGIEGRIEELHEKFNDPATYEDHEEVLKIQGELDELDRTKEEKFLLWSELTEELEG